MFYFFIFYSLTGKTFQYDLPKSKTSKSRPTQVYCINNNEPQYILSRLFQTPKKHLIFLDGGPAQSSQLTLLLSVRSSCASLTRTRHLKRMSLYNCKNKYPACLPIYCNGQLHLGRGEILEGEIILRTKKAALII